jgi:hypothetical protein
VSDMQVKLEKKNDMQELHSEQVQLENSKPDSETRPSGWYFELNLFAISFFTCSLYGVIYLYVFSLVGARCTWDFHELTTNMEISAYKWKITIYHMGFSWVNNQYGNICIQMKNYNIPHALRSFAVRKCEI